MRKYSVPLAQAVTTSFTSYFKGICTVDGTKWSMDWLVQQEVTTTTTFKLLDRDARGENVGKLYKKKTSPDYQIHDRKHR